MIGCYVKCCFDAIYVGWCGVDIDVYVDYGGVYLFLVYGFAVCVYVCGVVYLAESCLFLESYGNC